MNIRNTAWEVECPTCKEWLTFDYYIKEGLADYFAKKVLDEHNEKFHPPKPQPNCLADLGAYHVAYGIWLCKACKKHLNTTPVGWDDDDRIDEWRQRMQEHREGKR